MFTKGFRNLGILKTGVRTRIDYNDSPYAIPSNLDLPEKIEPLPATANKNNASLKEETIEDNTSARPGF